MLYIDKTNNTIINAKTEHSKVVSRYIKTYHNDGSDDIAIFINNNINEILNNEPDELLKLNKKFYSEISGYTYSEYEEYIIQGLSESEENRSDEQKEKLIKYNVLQSKISNIIKYDDWFVKQKHAYTLAKNLNRNTCTYCNRIYTNTVINEDNKKIIRPQFDHWFPKKQFPLLALSFYNLIPSCSFCNSSVKGDNIYELSTHVHPYIDKNDISNFKFTYDNNSVYDYKILLDKKTVTSKVEKTFEDLFLIEIYNSHISELQDIIKLKETYSENFIAILQNTFPDAGLSPKEIYRLVFGAYFNVEEFHKRPFSKFKKDILMKLGIIKDEGQSV